VTPLQPPSHDEIEAAAPVISGLITLAKWVAGPAAAAWVAGKFLVMTGHAKRKYEEVAEDIEAIKVREKSYITIPQHDAMQKICVSNLEHVVDSKLNTAVSDLRAEMSIMNGNICKIMGSLGIQDDGTQQRQRRNSDRGHQDDRS